jgi:diketogulonate reductase-like aldo/keto reductase
MTHIDTAEMYGSGASEEIIGTAIHDLPRHNLFIVSKVLPSNGSKKGTIAACERTLRRLKTDYLDCYLLHWRGALPLSETIEGFEKLIDDGKIRSMGVSNFDVEDLQEALKYATKPIACNQILYNLHTRGPERNIIPMCEKNKIAVVGYTPFAQRSPAKPGTVGGDLLIELAEKYDATQRQIILAFLVRSDNLFTIPKSADIGHTTENAGAGEIELSDKDISRLEEAFPAPAKDVALQMI